MYAMEPTTAIEVGVPPEKLCQAGGTAQLTRLPATNSQAVTSPLPKELISALVAVTVATGTGLPLLTPLEVTTAESGPRLEARDERKTVSSVGVAAVTTPTAPRSKATVLAAGVRDGSGRRVRPELEDQTADEEAVVGEREPQLRNVVAPAGAGRHDRRDLPSGGRARGRAALLEPDELTRRGLDDAEDVGAGGARGRRGRVDR